MIRNRQQLIGLLEFIFTFLFVYLTWISFYNLLQTSETSDFNFHSGAFSMALTFFIFIIVSRVYYPHMNPALTIFLHYFGYVKYETVV